MKRFLGLFCFNILLLSLHYGTTDGYGKSQSQSTSKASTPVDQNLLKQELKKKKAEQKRRIKQAKLEENKALEKPTNQEEKKVNQENKDSGTPIKQEQEAETKEERKKRKEQAKADRKARHLEAIRQKEEAKKLAELEKKNLKKRDRELEKELLIQSKANSNKNEALEKIKSASRRAKISKIEEIDAISPTQIATRINAGFSLAEFNGADKSLSFGGTFGLGLTTNIPISHIPNLWRIQPELNIQMVFLPKLASSTSSTSLSYYALQIPLLFRYRAIPDLHFYFGPSVYLTMDVVNKSGFSLRNAINTFNFGASVGLNYFIRHNLALELRYNRRFLPIYNPNDDNLKTIAPELMSNTLTHNNLEVGLIYYFKRDKPVKDITANSLADLYQDGDIFNLSKQLDPNDDADGDGVPYFKDACPTEKGSAWNNGCPADNDRDGVPNFKDSCIDIAGVLSNDGCPLNDKDKDGIIDQLDACPNEKGPQSNKGCPLNIAPQINTVNVKLSAGKQSILQNSAIIAFSNKEQQEIEEILKGIVFAKNKSTILDASLPSIQRLASFIRSHLVKGTQFSIFAYTMSIRRNRHNREVSDRRVRKLANALYKEGIATKDLLFEGREDLSSFERGDNTARTTLQLFWHKSLPVFGKKASESKKTNENKKASDSISTKAKPKDTTKLSIQPKTTIEKPTIVIDTTQKNLSFSEARALALAQKMSKDLEFSNGKTNFRSKKTAMNNLKQVVAFLKEYPTMNLVIHFLYLGSNEEKMLGKIARSRGEYIIKLLVKAGVAIDRIIRITKDMPIGQKSSNLLYEFITGDEIGKIKLKTTTPK